MFEFLFGRSRQLHRVERKLDELLEGQSIMATQNEELQAKVEELTKEVQEELTIMDSAAALINGFGARLQAAVDAVTAANPGVNLQPLVDLKDELNTHGDALAAAVAANTPAEPIAEETGTLDDPTVTKDE